MAIFVRDDDVLLPSKGGKDSLDRFKRVHELICSNPRFLHRAALLITEIQTVPGAVEYVYREMDKGRLFTEIHGWEHIDYGALPKETVIDHLKKCQNWLRDNGFMLPGRWYTPWGASQPHLHEAAKELGLELVDCSNRIKLRGTNGATDMLQKHGSLDVFEGKELAMHWWCRVDRERLEMLVNYDSNRG